MITDHVAAFHRYQQVRGLSPKTVLRRATSLRQFTAYIDPLPLLETHADLIDEWLGTFRSPATRKAYRSDLMAFFTWAARRDLCPNPVLRTDAIKVPNTLPRPVPPSYLPAILAAAEPDVRLMIALGAYAGLRCAEISALETSDLDLTSRSPTLAVRAGKGGKDRIVPVHPQLAKMLHGTSPGRLFCVSPRTVGRKVAVHLRSLGIEATAHKLRHSFGTELSRTTEGNLVLVARLMGHGNVSTTMKYVGWSGGPGVDAVGAMFPSELPVRGFHRRSGDQIAA